MILPGKSLTAPPSPGGAKPTPDEPISDSSIYDNPWDTSHPAHPGDAPGTMDQGINPKRSVVGLGRRVLLGLNRATYR